MTLQNELSELRLQVVELQNALAESEKDKTALLKTVSHDIKAPFNQLFALSSLLSMTSENLTEEQVEYVNRMHMVVKEGLNLIRNLIDLRTIDYRGVQFREDEINVDSILSETINHLKENAERKGVTIQSELLPAKTKLDKLYVGRIFDHLVSNAIKFSPNGSKVYVKMTEQEGQINIQVSDEGVGIPPKEENSLFKRFAVLSPRPTAGESTIGLGLYLAKAMAEGLQGSVNFIGNTPLTTFEINLPIKISSC